MCHEVKLPFDFPVALFTNSRDYVLGYKEFDLGLYYELLPRWMNGYRYNFQRTEMGLTMVQEIPSAQPCQFAFAAGGKYRSIERIIPGGIHFTTWASSEQNSSISFSKKVLVDCVRLTVLGDSPTFPVAVHISDIVFLDFNLQRTGLSSFTTISALKLTVPYPESIQNHIPSNLAEKYATLFNQVLEANCPID